MSVTVECLGDRRVSHVDAERLSVDARRDREAGVRVAAVVQRDPLECVDHVRALARRFNVRELVYDPWRFGQAAQELEREGLLVVAFPQHDARMIPASARLHAAVVELRLTLPRVRELARHAADAIARHSRRGWRIDKPNPRANIDAVIALAMAVERAEQVPEPVELLGWL
jgi:phage terminase large subunit-like protein